MRRVMAVCGTALMAVGIAAAGGPKAVAQTNVACIDHPGFPNDTGLALRGDAATTAGVLRLTPASGNAVGAAFGTTALNLTDSRGLDTTFQFRITEPDGIVDGDGQTGADGFALVFVTASDAPTGSSGGGIGYEGIPNSVAVEFDTFANKPGAPLEEINDPNGNHVGVHTRGQEPNSVLESNALGATTNIPNLSDGATHTARVLYQPPSGVTPGLRVFVDNLTTPVITLATFDMAATINLNAGQGFLGFTASTGAAWENHDILSWTACTVTVAAAQTTTTAPATTTTSLAATTSTTTAGPPVSVVSSVASTTVVPVATSTPRASTSLARTGGPPGLSTLTVLGAASVVMGVSLAASAFTGGRSQMGPLARLGRRQRRWG